MGINWDDIHRAYWIGDKMDRGESLNREDIEWLIRQKKKRAFFMAVQAAAMAVLFVFFVVCAMKGE